MTLEKSPSPCLGFVKIDFLIGTKWGSNVGRKQNRPSPGPEDPAKVLISINWVAEVYPNYQPVNTPSSQKTPKNPSRQPTIKNLFSSEQTENIDLRGLGAGNRWFGGG